MNYLYRIPPIQWDKDKHSGRYFSTNTFQSYDIHLDRGRYVCFYKQGAYKEFNSLNEAKDWAEQIHYPAQVAKYLERVYEPI